MKKLLVMLLSVIALASCASNMQEKEMMKEEKPVAVETMKETEKDTMKKEEMTFSFENSEVLKQSDKIISNYHSKKGFKHSHVTLVMSPSLDVALFGMDGMEYELTRQKSASGVVYSSKDGKVVISIHQGTLYVENGTDKIEYFELGTDKLDFHKASHHHH